MVTQPHPLGHMYLWICNYGVPCSTDQLAQSQAVDW